MLIQLTSYEEKNDLKKVTKPYHQALDHNSNLEFWLICINRIRILKNEK